jgi:ribose/xylose/arabinose/galactoside ABC-type transport system permease subunit
VLRGSALGLAEQAPVNLTGTWLSELMYVGGKDVQWSDPIRWGILWPGRVLMILTIAVAAGAMMWRALRGKGSYASIIRLGLALLLGSAGGYAIYAAWYWAPGIWLTAMFALAVSLMLRYTRLGRHIVAIGSNEQTARLCGVAVRKVKIFVYAMGGLAAALGGLMLTAKQDQGDPTGQIGAELDVIAAVVIGGGSLSGGVGSIWGSIIGAFIMQTIRYGCTMVGLEAWITQIVTGGIIIAAVALDRLRHRRSA